MLKRTHMPRRVRALADLRALVRCRSATVDEVPEHDPGPTFQRSAERVLTRFPDRVSRSRSASSSHRSVPMRRGRRGPGWCWRPSRSGKQARPPAPSTVERVHERLADGGQHGEHLWQVAQPLGELLLAAGQDHAAHPTVGGERPQGVVRGSPCPTPPRLRGRPTPTAAPDGRGGTGPLDRCGVGLRASPAATWETTAGAPSSGSNQVSVSAAGTVKRRAGDASQHAADFAGKVTSRSNARSISGSTVIPAPRSRDVGDGCGVRRRQAPAFTPARLSVWPVWSQPRKALICRDSSVRCCRDERVRSLDQS